MVLTHEHFAILRAMPGDGTATAAQLGRILCRPSFGLGGAMSALAVAGYLGIERHKNGGGARYWLTDLGRAAARERPAPAAPRIRRRTLVMIQHCGRGANGAGHAAGTSIMRVSLPAEPWADEGESWRGVGDVARDMVRETGRA